jgi:hypothetical protein
MVLAGWEQQTKSWKQIFPVLLDSFFQWANALTAPEVDVDNEGGTGQDYDEEDMEPRWNFHSLIRRDEETLLGPFSKDAYVLFIYLTV